MEATHFWRADFIIYFHGFVLGQFSQQDIYQLHKKKVVKLLLQPVIIRNMQIFDDIEIASKDTYGLGGISGKGLSWIALLSSTRFLVAGASDSVSLSTILTDFNERLFSVPLRTFPGLAGDEAVVQSVSRLPSWLLLLEFLLSSRPFPFSINIRGLVLDLSPKLLLRPSGPCKKFKNAVHISI